MTEANDNAAKAGARHSAGDVRRGRAVKQKAREIIADMDELGFNDEQAVGHPADPAPSYTKSDMPTDAPDAPVIFGAVKAAGEWELDVLYLPYGGPQNGKDSQGEYFSPRTNEHADKFPEPVILYYHGADPDGRAMGDPNVIGRAVKRWADGAGRWVRVKLDQANQYARRVWEAAQKGLARASSGSIAHLVRRESDGHITNWPVVEVSLIDTEGRRRPANSYAVALPAAKAHLKLAGLAMPAEFTINDESAMPQATGAHSPAERSAQSQSHPIGVTDMDEQKVSEIVAAALKADREQREASEKAEAARQAQEESKIKAAVDAERAKFEKEQAALKAQYVAAGRLNLGDGQAPYQARFADTRKYDGMGPNDLAFMGALLASAKASNLPRAQGFSESAAKALAIKIAEDRTTVRDMTGRETDLGEQSRAGLKALGVDPAHVLDAAKANEVNYSTLASYGDDWVGIEYSRRLWPAVRAGTFALQKLPQVEVPQGMESVVIPLESGDPTFYKVAQTTDENATTGTPNATVTSSKLGTAKSTLTVAKGGARTSYSGELDEDSLVPWAAQLRAQLERATAEQLEHALIDGDTETAATTNINDIGGTPAGTEFFMLVNGFRKSPLVTTTANARSASGSLVDTDFLETVYLMGTAGLIGYDPTKVDFIIDPNTHKKAIQLASVKTRDVFTGATLEGGRLTQIWNYPVNVSFFMHYMSSARKANTAGKVDQDTTNNNTTGAILAVRWDQWLFGWKRRVTIETVRIPRADVTEITALMRFGLLQRDTEGAAITYNVGL